MEVIECIPNAVVPFESNLHVFAELSAIDVKAEMIIIKKLVIIGFII